MPGSKSKRKELVLAIVLLIEWVSSFLTAHQHKIGHSVPYMDKISWKQLIYVLKAKLKYLLMASCTL